jgi:hypothetical protein
MEHIVNVERMYLETIYRIKLKRMAKGYSQELVSATIGRELDFMGKIEMLETKINTEYELQEIAWALGEDNLSGFLPLTQDHTTLNVIMADDVFGTTRIQRCDILINSEKQVPFFHFQEEVNFKPTVSVN